MLRAILHELLHLKYPNHGRMFHRLLNTYMVKLGGIGLRKGLSSTK